jgi:hypothetical protein
MISFTTTILKYGKQGEKTGWTYIVIPYEMACRLKENNKKTFRVKGKLDQYKIKSIAILPIGNGDFILSLNAEMRKQIKKSKGATLNVQLEKDEEEIMVPSELLECLNDEPKALIFFNGLPKSHRNYFIKWIVSAKTDITRAGRIACAINALSIGWGFAEMIRNKKQQRFK